MAQDPSVRLVTENRLGVVQLELQSSSGQSSTADLTLVRFRPDAVSIDQGNGSMHAELGSFGVEIDEDGLYGVSFHCPFTTMANGGDRNAIVFKNASDADLASGWPDQSKWMARDEYVSPGTTSSTDETETVHATNIVACVDGDLITAVFLQHRREGSGSSSMVIGEDPGQRASLTVWRVA